MTASTIIVNDVEPRRQYTATGGQTVFDFPIPFFDTGDLTVWLTPVGQTADDTADLLTITTDYTVTGENTQDGGEVTLVVPATAGDIVTIERIVDIERLADYQNSGDLLAETLNKEQDTEIFISQQLRQDIQRSLQLPKSGTITNGTLPAAEALKFIRVNAAGDGFEYVTGTESSNAVNVAFTPAGNIEAANVQAAIEELDAEKEPADPTILKDADIGVTVQAYDADTPKEIVSQVDAEAGTATDPRTWTAERVKQAIDALTPATTGVLSTDDVFHGQDQKTVGTNGGTFTSGAWQTRIINTEVTNTITGASLSSNQITLPAGDYWIEAEAIGRSVNAHQSRLYNATDASIIMMGTSSYSNGGDNNGSPTTKIKGKFTLAASKAIEFQHRCGTTRADTGYGIPANLTGSNHEVYLNIIIWKVS